MNRIDLEKILWERFWHWALFSIAIGGAGIIIEIPQVKAVLFALASGAVIAAASTIIALGVKVIIEELHDAP